MPDTDVIAQAFDAVPLPMVLISADARLTAMNGAAMGVLEPLALGRHHTMAMRQPGLVSAIEAALQTGQGGVVNGISFGGLHESVWRVTVTGIALEGGWGAVCAFEDLTEQEQIGQLRRDFVANVSHELRTPLTALVGFIETLRGPAKEDAVARERFLGIMDREAGRMIRLVRDLLSLSRVEAQERQKPTDTVDLAESVQMAVASLRQTIEAAGCEVVVTGADQPAVVQADADQLAQIWQNLIENAVKYGGTGKRVTIAITQVSHDPALRGPGVEVAVTDQGEGIDPLHVPRLTERFYRVDSHRSREAGGTGLGLAIVKHIVNRHRGRLRISSAAGQGSTFAVRLPKG